MGIDDDNVFAPGRSMATTKCFWNFDAGPYCDLGSFASSSVWKFL
jgi:hypothetical protein